MTVLYPTLTYDADSGEPLIPPRTFGALKTVSIKVSATEDTSSYIEMRRLGSALISTFDAPGILYSLSVVRCPLHDAMGYRVEWLTATKMLKMIKPLLLVKTLARCLRTAGTRHGGAYRHLASDAIMQLEFAPMINRIISPPLRPVRFPFSVSALFGGALTARRRSTNRSSSPTNAR